MATMNVDHLIAHYKTQAAAAAAIEVTPQAVSKWKGREIPIEFQIRWEMASSGVLRADIPEEIRRGASFKSSVEAT